VGANLVGVGRAEVGAEGQSVLVVLAGDVGVAFAEDGQGLPVVFGTAPTSVDSIE
jgi:hypothetical protein